MNTLAAMMLILLGTASMYAGINALVDLYAPGLMPSPSCRPGPDDASSAVMLAAEGDEIPDWVITDLARAVDAIEAGEPERAKTMAERALDEITPEWRLYR